MPGTKGHSGGSKQGGRKPSGKIGFTVRCLPKNKQAVIEYAKELDEKSPQ